MRNFESFLTRRRIKDFRSWCASSGIESFEKFRTFCETQELSFDSDKYAKIFSELPDEEKPQAPKAPAKKPDVKAETSEESWHVPAAERPIKARRTTRKTPVKKAAPKPKAKPRARKAKKD